MALPGGPTPAPPAWRYLPGRAALGGGRDSGPGSLVGAGGRRTPRAPHFRARRARAPAAPRGGGAAAAGGRKARSLQSIEAAGNLAPATPDGRASGPVRGPGGPGGASEPGSSRARALGRGVGGKGAGGSWGPWPTSGHPRRCTAEREPLWGRARGRLPFGRPPRPHPHPGGRLSNPAPKATGREQGFLRGARPGQPRTTPRRPPLTAAWSGRGALGGRPRPRAASRRPGSRCWDTVLRCGLHLRELLRTVGWTALWKREASTSGWFGKGGQGLTGKKK